MAMASQISLGTCTNLRDVGGARTASGRILRRGRLFRSDSLHRLTELEASALKGAIGPRTIIDLRGADEVLRFGAGPLEQTAHYIHFPIGAEAPGTGLIRRREPSLLDLYVAMAEESATVIAEIVRVLGMKDVLPAIVFCAAGKDRTGVAMAMVLGSLNITDEDIVADYAATPMVDPSLLGDGYAERFKDLPATYRQALPETMLGFLAAMRRKYGSLRAYMAHHGVARDDLRNLERALLARD